MAANEPTQQTPGGPEQTPEPDVQGEPPVAAPAPSKKRTRSPAPKAPERIAPRLKWQMILISGAIGAGIFVMLSFVFNRSDVDGIARFVIVATVDLVPSALFFFAMPGSKAALDGTAGGTKFRFGGAAAFYIALTFIALKCTPEARSRTIDAVLVDASGRAINKDFTLTFRLPDVGQQQRKGTGGQAELRGLPNGAKTIEVQEVICPGLRMRDSSPHQITDGKISIVMVEATEPPPEALDLPPVRQEMLPDRATVMTPPKVKPEDVTFTCENLSGDDVTLFIYDCYRHYHINSRSLDVWPETLKFDLKANAVKRHERFRDGTGWYLFFIRGPDKRFHKLALKNLYQIRAPKLVVRKRAEGSYLADFNLED